MVNDKRFGEYLRKYRQQNRMTQEELAEKLGTSKQVISNYEKFYRSPRISMAVKIAEQLGVTLEDILGIDKAESREEELLAYFRALSEEGQLELIKRAAEMLYVYGKKNKKTSRREAAL